MSEFEKIQAMQLREARKHYEAQRAWHDEQDRLALTTRERPWEVHERWATPADREFEAVNDRLQFYFQNRLNVPEALLIRMHELRQGKRS